MDADYIDAFSHEELLRRWPDAQVVMVSSLAYDDMVEQARSMGAKGFLFKPFEKQALIDGLKSVLEGGTAR